LLDACKSILHLQNRRILLPVAHGRFRRAPKLWNVRRGIGAVTVGAVRKHRIASSSSGMREGRKVRRSLCPTSEANERSHACSTWQGPRSHFSGDRCARHRLVATELRRQLGHSAGRALQLPLPIRDKRFCDGAREARSVDRRRSAHPLRLPQRGSRAPAPFLVGAQSQPASRPGRRKR